MAIVVENMQFRPLKEEWNVYRLSDGSTLSMKPLITEISRTGLYDDLGQPVYRVMAQAIVKGKPAKK
ncbi:MAG: hypothetical protein QW064_04230 [Candidatus Caldarchaeum sp.]